MSEYCWAIEGLSENVVDAIALDHHLHVGPGNKELVADDIAEEAFLVADIDIAFAKLNPHLPIENVCSRLDNYNPQNESQQALLGMATKLVSYMNPARLAGFIACGTAGLGKTHVSIGVAKAAMLTGQTPLYINVPSRGYPTPEEMEKAKVADIVIIDDFNKSYGGAFNAKSAEELLAFMHNRGGGKLMITSNAPDTSTFLDKILLPMDPIERVRIKDRVSAGLADLNIVGESYRSKSAAGQKPWWEE